MDQVKHSHASLLSLSPFAVEHASYPTVIGHTTVQFSSSGKWYIYILQNELGNVVLKLSWF